MYTLHQIFELASVTKIFIVVNDYKISKANIIPQKLKSKNFDLVVNCFLILSLSEFPCSFL